MEFRYTTVGLAFAVASAPVSAEYFGLLNGRSADLSQLADTSVEVGFITGDIEIGDFEKDGYQQIGGRLNYRLQPELMLLADIGQSEYGDDDGITYGIGAFYQMGGVFTSVDFAVKGSFHTGSLDVEGADDDADVQNIGIEGLFSSRDPIGESQLRWYANAGLHRLKAEFLNASESDTGFGFGGGVFSDTANGQFYAGADLIGELTFGLGYRHYLQ